MEISLEELENGEETEEWKSSSQSNEDLEETISEEWEYSDENAFDEAVQQESDNLFEQKDQLESESQFEQGDQLESENLLEQEEQLDSDYSFEMLSDNSYNLEVGKGTSIISALSAQYHTTSLIVSNGGPWGDWGEIEYCREGAYAVGYDLKIEPHQGFGTGPDDTALNAIKLICEFPDGTYGGRPTSLQGPWGDWQGHDTCRSGNFLTGFRMQVEEPQGRRTDDTSANFVKFKCRDLAGQRNERELYHSNGRGLWGEYGEWSRSCRNGQAICGLQTKVERSLGVNGDDTSLNDVKFFCCN